MPPPAEVPRPQRLEDRFGRTVRYLRLSVTERCNMRCRYCLPEGIRWDKETDMLSYEEMARLIRIFAGLGVHKVRLTGGEPLVRRELPLLVRLLRDIPGIDQLMMTTNGLLLARQAAALKAAGLGRLNISLDTLDPERFEAVTRGARLEDVLEGIEEARKQGFGNTKLNVVVMRDFNLEETPALVEWAHERDLTPCFIELMPMGEKPFSADQYAPTAEVKARLGRRLDLDPVADRIGSGPARYLRSRQTGGLVGFISPLSGNFCADCNRMRLSAEGKVRNCLAYEKAGDFRPLLRDPAWDDGRIAAHVARHLLGKGADHAGFADTDPVAANVMMAIGG